MDHDTNFYNEPVKKETCPHCGRSFNVQHYVKICHNVIIPDLLSNCMDCDYWDNKRKFCDYEYRNNLVKICSNVKLSVKENCPRHR